MLLSFCAMMSHLKAVPLSAFTLILQMLSAVVILCAAAELLQNSAAADKINDLSMHC